MWLDIMLAKNSQYFSSTIRFVPFMHPLGGAKPPIRVPRVKAPLAPYARGQHSAPQSDLSEQRNNFVRESAPPSHAWADESQAAPHNPGLLQSEPFPAAVDGRDELQVPPLHSPQILQSYPYAVLAWGPQQHTEAQQPVHTQTQASPLGTAPAYFAYAPAGTAVPGAWGGAAGQSDRAQGSQGVPAAVAGAPVADPVAGAPMWGLSPIVIPAGACAAWMAPHGGHQPCGSCWWCAWSASGCVPSPLHMLLLCERVAQATFNEPEAAAISHLHARARDAPPSETATRMRLMMACGSSG